MKDPKWRQANPIDQHTALCGALEGHLLNLEESLVRQDNRFDRLTIVRRCILLIDELRMLEPFLEGARPWDEKPE